ncbi:hypothetical protein MKW92_024005 [Papaver armeniacum]|nr:hypothetical protein MKW92_024005 [Papaver armeniacum]
MGAAGGATGGASDGVTLRLWWCFFFAFAVISSVCSARSIASAGDEIMMVGAGRSLKAMINDYDPPTANPGHTPPGRRTLKAMINDYDPPTANKGHTPPSRRTLKAMINDYDPPTANKKNDNRRIGGRSSGGTKRKS